MEVYEKKHNASVENASVGESLEDEAFTEKVIFFISLISLIEKKPRSNEFLKTRESLARKKARTKWSLSRHRLQFCRKY